MTGEQISELQLLSNAWLVPCQKRLRILALAGQLEGAEVLAPRTFRDFGIFADPFNQFQQVFFGDPSCSRPIFEVFPHVSR